MSFDDLKEASVSKPGHNTVNASSGSSEYDTMQYNADLQKFRKAVFSSQEFGTSSGSSGDMSQTPKPKQQQLL